MPDTTDTQTTPSGEEQKPIPGIENIIEPGSRTQADVRSAEEMLVQRLLGVDLRAVNMNQPAEIARRIVERTSAILVNTRDQVARLGGVLEREILANWLRGRDALVGEPRSRNRAEAVIEAVRHTFPTEVIRELVERLWPTVYRADLRDHLIETKSSELVIELVQLHGRLFDLVVDADHPFWKVTDPKKIEDSLVGKTFKDCGIRPLPDTHGRGYKITKADAEKIIRALSTQICLLDTNAEDPTLNNHRGYIVRLKLRNLLAEQAESRQFSTVLQLREFLSNAWVWNRYVEVIRTGKESGPIPDHTDLVAIPALTGKAFLLSGTVPLGIGKATLHNVASHQHALYRFRDPLLKGEVNPWDVAAAMTMIEQQGHLADTLAGQGNREAIQHMSHRAALARVLKQLDVQEGPNVPRANINWSINDIDIEIGLIDDDIRGAATGYTPTCHFAPHVPLVATQVRNIQLQLTETRKELSEAQRILRTIGSSLARAREAIDGLPDSEATISSFPQLQTLTNAAVPPAPPTPNTANIRLSINPKAIAAEVSKVLTQLRDEQYYGDEVKKLQSQSGSPPIGADGIHAIYKAYFKGKNLSEREAQNAANALMARNACDAQMEEVVQDVTRAQWPITMNENREEWPPLPRPGQGSTWLERWGYRGRGADIFWFGYGRRIRNVVNHVAAAIAIPLRGQAGRLGRASTREPDIGQASPEQLVQFYFALKSLVGANRRMYLPGYEMVTQEYLRTVGMLLTRRYAKALLYMFKGRLPGDFGQDDKAIEAILGQPEKLQAILAELLAGDVPEAHKAAIEKALTRAEHEFEFWRRTLLVDRLVGDKWSVKKAIASETNPLSLRNIYFGRWGMFGLPWRILKWGGGVAKEAPGAVWAERKPIALGAILGTLFLPGVGTAIGAAVGGAYRKIAA